MYGSLCYVVQNLVSNNEVHLQLVRRDSTVNKAKVRASMKQISYKDLVGLSSVNTLNAELNPICYLLALLAHHFLHVSRIRVKSLTLRLLMSSIYIYIYGAPILDVSRSHTTTHHSR